ncbi:MAG: hypothetical protein IJV04_05495, partial [Lachnospiraceae bacterium]|nr:hypothetical protein [Lachnospiraceae bacterium]
MKKKKSLAAILCACSLLVGLAAPVSVQQVEAAKAKDVTESMKNNRDLRFIANQVNLFVESDAKVDPGTGPVRGKKIKLTKNRKVDIVSTAICAAQDEDEISTKVTIRKGMYARVDRNVLENHYERLFGDDVDLDSVKLNYKKNATTIKKNGRFYS